MTDRQTLLEKVRACEGADRLLDEALMMAFYTRDVRFIGATCEGCDCPDAPRHKDPVWVDPMTDRWVSTNAYEFTGSVDRALALVAKVLPGWDWMRLAGGRMLVFDPARHKATFAGEAKTPALALLAALLTALLAEEAGK